MKSFLTALAMTGSAASSAMAADLPARTAPVVPQPIIAPAPAWTGCYVGGNLGGALGDASVSGAAGTVSTNGSGFAGGGQIGCDYQFASGWVIGFPNMFDGTLHSRSGTIGSGPRSAGVFD